MKVVARSIAVLALVQAGCATSPEPPPAAAPSAEAVAEAAEGPAAAAAPAEAVYICEAGDTVRATYGLEGANVVHGGKAYVMQLMESASGSAYTDGKLIWHTKGDEGMLREVDGDRVLARACRAADGAPAAAPAASLPAEVVDATWQWVGMTTPVEQITVSSPERYTLRFESSGRISLQADCNRGGSSYTVTADRKISLGALALTRMMCPPGSQSDRFIQELARVSSYFTKDGGLFLAAGRLGHTPVHPPALKRAGTAV